MSNITHPTVPAENVEIAMSLWEAVFLAIDTYPDLSYVRDQIGLAQFRKLFASPAMVATCEAAFMIAEDHGYTDTFDQDWCPVFVRSMLDIDTEKNTIRPTEAWKSHAKFVASAAAIGLPLFTDSTADTRH